MADSSSSTSGMSAVATRTKNAVILDVQTLQTTAKKLESEIRDLKQQSAASDQKYIDLAEELRKFKVWAGRNELNRRQLDKKQSETEEQAMRAGAGVGAGNDSGGSDSESETDVVMTEAEKGKIEASAAAAGSNVLKVGFLFIQ